MMHNQVMDQIRNQVGAPSISFARIGGTIVSSLTDYEAYREATFPGEVYYK